MQRSSERRGVHPRSRHEKFVVTRQASRVTPLRRQYSSWWYPWLPGRQAFLWRSEAVGTEEGVVPCPFCQVASNTDDRRHWLGSTRKYSVKGSTAGWRWHNEPEPCRRAQMRAGSEGGPASLPFLPGYSTRRWGCLLPHSRDLKAMMSAPSSDKRPLPTIIL